MKEYVIGVDIGGTKSRLALFDTEGCYVDMGFWGGLNHEGLEGSFAQFKDELSQFVTQVLDKNGVELSQIAFSALGVSGVDTKKQHETVSRIIEDIGLKNFTLVNDAYLGILAGSKTAVGICAINGTGSTLAGINKNGRMLQIGGVGFISADKGGGGYIGERMVSKVYCELFRKGEPTIMTCLLLKKLGITSKYDFVEAVQEKMQDGSFDVYKSSQLVFEAVRRGDPEAKGIMSEIADSYAGGIACMIEELEFPPDEELCVVLAGSVFVKGEHPFLIDTLKEKVSGDHPRMNITYNLPDVPNVAGAVVWALNSLNGGGCYEKVCAQLRG
jgi:N-acetylglucosamine kinase-like BadF-type ATPase